MNNVIHKSFRDVVGITISNIVNLLSGVIVGFLLPKIIDVPNYGYYKIFTLYASYAGMFGLGIIDGIYLQYCGKTYDDLDKSRFRFYSRLIILIQVVFAIIIAIISCIFMKNEYKFIFCTLAIYLVFNNIIGYYQIVSQITLRFNELSKRNFIQSILTSVAVIILWVTSKYTDIAINYRIYLFIYVCVFAFMAFWYCKTYKDIIWGESIEIPKFSEVKVLIKIGLPLLFANLSASLLFSLDRQFVSILFDTTIYAMYSFAYNLLALVTTATSAIALVIFPYLKQKSKNTLIDQYDNLVFVVLFIVFLSLSIYYPLCWFIELILPQYLNSLPIFRVIFPGLAVNSAITVVMHNYYKTLGINNIYFAKSIIALIISFLSNLIAYKFWHSEIAISWASIMSLLIWYILVERYLVKRYKVKTINNFIYLISMMVLFYLVSYCITNDWLALLLYCGGLVIFTSTFCFKKIVLLWNSRK